MDRRARTIMFQGTGSGVGKSVAAAAFCRVLARRGVRVVPFKAQNMALNSFVTPDGKEMGRAQVFQAEACGLAPDVRMNPILLKPSADAASQVIVMGEAVGHYSARAYYQEFEAHRRVAREAFDALAAEYEVVVLEGAGSPAEINLQDTDLVNMDMAAHARAPVVLVGDIDRGGVFAWIKGTYDLIPEAHRGLVAGFLVNKFRGDPGLLRPGIEAFARLVPVPCLGVLPMFRDIEVDQEDGVHVEALERRGARRPIRVVVVRPERISNFTDFGSLAAEPDVSLVFARRPEEAEGADCLVLPGTKATMADLEILRRAGWGEALAAAAADGVPVVGLCGGYQMLGEEILDPAGVEGGPARVAGFGLLPVVTEMAPAKVLARTRAVTAGGGLLPGGLPAEGYEIHMGRTRASGEVRPLFEGRGPGLGCRAPGGDVLGTYLHGLFDADGLRHAFLDALRRRRGLAPLGERPAWRAARAAHLDRLADWLEAHADLPRLLALVGL